MRFSLPTSATYVPGFFRWNDQVQLLQLQMQVPVPKTLELEVIGLPSPVFCRVYGVDERVRFASTRSG